MTTPAPAPLHYPLVCEPERIEGAEERIRQFPRLRYDWAIKYALTPLTVRKPKRARADQDTGVTFEYLERLKRHTVRA